jgi:ParB/RepB/Spo0J family partition protein
VLDPWPDQPRSRIDPDFVEELAVSIGDEGVLQALTVRPTVGGGRFQVVIGETRRQASLRAVELGLQPAGFAVPCKIRAVDDDKAFEIALAENVQRDDLHWMDEAEAAAKLFTRGRSAAQISRIFGEKRGKRQLNDFIAIAQRLPAEVKARAYLPAKGADGKDNAERLTYTQARELLKPAEEKPALLLTPKLAMTLLEILATARHQSLAPGMTVETQLHSPPGGGPLVALQTDKKLIDFGFSEIDGARRMVVRVKITAEILTWLEQIGWRGGVLPSPEQTLFRFRAAVIGDLQALRRPGRWRRRSR